MCSVFPVPLVLSANPVAGFHVWMEKTDSTWCSWRISTKFLCPWSTAVPKEETLSTRFQRRRRCQLACCVSWKVLCPTPQALYLCLTGNSGDFPLTSCKRKSWFVSTLWAKKKGKKLTKILYYQILLNLSLAIKYIKPDMRPVPIFSYYIVKLVIPN